MNDIFGEKSNATSKAIVKSTVGIVFGILGIGWFGG
tara:strand:- start:3 stop:110 length:108 start_codon:yes stop_codon:yes gene_type:complete